MAQCQGDLLVDADKEDDGQAREESTGVPASVTAASTFASKQLHNIIE